MASPIAAHPNLRRRWRLVAAVLTGALLLVACGSDDASPASASTTSVSVEDVDADDVGLPAVVGYYDGEEILFVHPEASDAGIAATLEGMMGSSPVIHVPGLAEVPDSALATVYVFTNGIVPDAADAMGPLGFQPDVFDTAPGDAGYSPLRRLVTVTWSDPDGTTILTDTAAILSAESDGRVQLEHTDVVVNMPFIRWPGGQR